MAINAEAPHLPPPSPKSPYVTKSTPKSARSRTPTRSSLSPLKHGPFLDRLSPLKTRALQPHARSPARSPRKSPSKPFLQETGAKNVSFTPQRTKQPPRAWERRPATPFVPRDDKQKIWKRVPLGELGVDTNRPTGVSRRELERTKDYTRVVKKLKVEREDGDDKENIAFAIGAKMQREDGDEVLERPNNQQSAVNFVTMRVEEDEIWGSPKKKLRRVLDVDDHAIIEPSEDTAQSGDDDGETLSQQDEYECVGAFEEQSTDWSKEDALVQEYVDEGANNVVLNDKILQGHTDPDSPTDVEADLYLEHESAPSHTDGNMSTSVANQLHLATGSDFISQEGCEAMGETHIDNNKADETADTEVERAVVDSAGNTNIEEVHKHYVLRQDTGSDQDPIEEATEEDRSSSPPTILAENVTVDELAAKDSSAVDQAGQHIHHEPKDQADESEEQNVQIRQENIPRRISDDEAAFLRDFMSRTKAERAAREQASQHMDQEEMSPAEQAVQRVLESLDDAHQNEASPAKIELPASDSTETASTSPLRRSKRAAVTGLMQPQSIPNSIQLKRANGNEFIFTANKASSLANVALVTRSNTKKNKGIALNVPARLEQLLVERANEENEASQNGCDLEKPLAEISNSQALKKRKRDKNDRGVKVKKVLRWNDENLVSYQEAQKSLGDDWEDIEDSSQEYIYENSQDHLAKHVKLTLTVGQGLKDDDSVQEQQKMAEQKDDRREAASKKKDQNDNASSQTKVRRVRRGIAGSVNGTPAPKTRSKKFFDVDEPTVDLQSEEGRILDSSSASSATARSLASEDTAKTSISTSTTIGARKSRMPVPSSRRGAAISASGKAGVAIAIPAAASSKPSNADTEPSTGRQSVKSQSSAESERGDVLGHRRLRVRS